MGKMKYSAREKPITNWNEVPVIFDIPMAARLLGKSYDWISRRCLKGELPAFKDGMEWRFEKEEFLEYIRQSRVVSYTKKGA